jgi:hypothetical protein
MDMVDIMDTCFVLSMQSAYWVPLKTTLREFWGHFSHMVSPTHSKTNNIKHASDMQLDLVGPFFLNFCFIGKKVVVNLTLRIAKSVHWAHFNVI